MIKCAIYIKTGNLHYETDKENLTPALTIKCFTKRNLILKI